MIGKKRVVIGLSGGVDSSVAAALLIEQGYDVSGAYLECYNEPGCRTDQDKSDALKIAMKLGINFQVIDFRKKYKEKVIEYFYREYEAGRTPNPDIMCNKEIKFGIFYEYAIQHGFDYVATGHYCRVTRSQGSVLCSEGEKTKDGTLFLQMARDESKDQSYFLWQIPSDHLEHVLFPLGEMLKSEVRAKARELNLITADKPDSMGICFIGDINVNNLLKERLGENPGRVVLSSDHSLSQGSELREIGTHRGLWFYTIGERGGFELDKAKMKKLGMHPEKMPPLYVIDKNVEKNQLVVGYRQDTMKSEFKIQDVKFNKIDKEKLWVRIRNLGELYEVSSLLRVDGSWVVSTAIPIFGVAEGQSCVFYDQNKVLVGGSIIV